MKNKDYPSQTFSEEVFKEFALKEKEMAIMKAETEYYKVALEELVETVDDALFLDYEEAQAWEDLYRGVLRAREVLDGVGLVNESGAV